MALKGRGKAGSRTWAAQRSEFLLLERARRRRGGPWWRHGLGVHAARQDGLKKRARVHAGHKGQRFWPALVWGQSRCSMQGTGPAHRSSLNHHHHHKSECCYTELGHVHHFFSFFVLRSYKNKSYQQLTSHTPARALCDRVRAPFLPRKLFLSPVFFNHQSSTKKALDGSISLPSVRNGRHQANASHLQAPPHSSAPWLMLWSLPMCAQ
jgi:hypothetical protein